MTITTSAIHDALLIIDVQNDFLPGGALSVPDGDRVIAPINKLSGFPFRCVIASQDWHPPEHISFDAVGGPWPSHCVRGTHGAELAHALDQTRIRHIVRKGTSPAQDSYSAFCDDGGMTTGLAALLRGLDVRRVFVTGLALDFCVAATALDARREGFDTVVVVDACRPVHIAWDTTQTSLRNVGVETVYTRSFTDVRAP